MNGTGPFCRNSVCLGGIGFVAHPACRHALHGRAAEPRHHRALRPLRAHGPPGLNVKIPLIEGVAQRVSLRVQQLPVEVETKTLDNVFVKLFVAVQYRVVEGQRSGFLLQAAEPCATRSRPTCSTWCGQGAQDESRRSVRKEGRGRRIGEDRTRRLDENLRLRNPNALVTDVNPADNVKAAMNEIQTQQRLQVAAAAKGEANKILGRQECRSRGGIQAPSGRRHRQAAARHRRRLARIDRGLHRQDRRRHRSGSAQARADDAIFRHA